MIETHPFDVFAPDNARYLLLGSFTGRQAVAGSSFWDPGYDWYYGSRRNQFWPILEQVYGVALPGKAERQALFSRLGMAVADIILQCERRDANNMDSNLRVIAYNTQAICAVIEGYPIEQVFFTSRFVESEFKKVFKTSMAQHPSIEWICLPSPSPRYARMRREEKISRCKALLPKG